MSGGGAGVVTKKSSLGFAEGLANTATFGGYNKATGRGTSFGRGAVNALTLGTATSLEDKLTPPEAPSPEDAPVMEDIAAMEPDKEKRRRQRMAALMAQGRQGTILTGPSGVTPSNSIGGGGKQMVGA